MNKTGKREVVIASGLALGIGMVWALGVSLAVGLVGSAIYWMRPAWLGWEREAFVASHQYQEAHGDQLARLKQQRAELRERVARFGRGPLRRALEEQLEAVEDRIATEERKLAR